jgi:hypothetical protein
MAESPFVKILVALIGAVAVIAAAWIGASSREGEDRRGTQRKGSEPAQVTAQEGDSSKTKKSKEHYETIATVFEGKAAFVDPETGLVFAVEDVHDWKLPSLTGATCRYSLPNSKWLGHGDREC